MNNLLDDIPAELPAEFFETLAEGHRARIERIVSRGHTTPAGEWYDQERDEFVVLLRGAAVLQLDDEGEKQLVPGDWLVIPAHCRHRVSWTDEHQDTVWLAIHYE